MKLHQMSKRGEWSKMAAEVPDEVVRSFAAVATHDGLAAAIEERFGGIVDTLTLQLPGEPDRVREIVRGVQRIPSPFEGHAGAW